MFLVQGLGVEGMGLIGSLFAISRPRFLSVVSLQDKTSNGISYGNIKGMWQIPRNPDCCSDVVIVLVVTTTSCGKSPWAWSCNPRP